MKTAAELYDKFMQTYFISDMNNNELCRLYEYLNYARKYNTKPTKYMGNLISKYLLNKA